MNNMCDLCGKAETGRVIAGKYVCDKCFLKGQYNLPENQAKLNEKPESAKPQVKKIPKRR